MDPEGPLDRLHDGGNEVGDDGVDVGEGEQLAENGRGHRVPQVCVDNFGKSSVECVNVRQRLMNK